MKIRKTYHLRQTPRRNDISSMNQTVKMSRGLLDVLPHLIIAIEIEHIRHEIQRILVVLDLGVETSQVETIR